MPTSTEDHKTSRDTRKDAWKLLLLLPFAGLLFPQLYTRMEPVLWGFPFFYWYQFAWVFVASAIMFAVYKKIKK